MATNFNASGKCNKCGLTSADCAGGFSDSHIQVKLTEDICLNGQTRLAGQLMTLPSKVWTAHKMKHTVLSSTI